MSNLTNLQIPALEVSGRNYLTWALDVKMHLQAMNLEDTIKARNNASRQDKAKAMIFLRHHLQESLKTQYLTEEDPLVLWKNLKERYDHQKDIFLPRAEYEWSQLRLQDFTKVHDYNSELYRITSQLKLCGVEISENAMLEKTLSTFHASSLVLQQQYRERRYTKYSELISSLLVAEQNNELLLKNHEMRPTGSQAFPEANANAHNSYRRNRRGRRGRGYYPHDGHRHSGHRNNNNRRHQKWNVYKRQDDKSPEKKDVRRESPKKDNDNICYRCGGKGHWSRTCRTEKHLVDLYQASRKGKGKIETNLVNDSDPIDLSTHLDASDFLTGNRSENID